MADHRVLGNRAARSLQLIVFDESLSNSISPGSTVRSEWIRV